LLALRKRSLAVSERVSALETVLSTELEVTDSSGHPLAAFAGVGWHCLPHPTRELAADALSRSTTRSAPASARWLKVTSQHPTLAAQSTLASAL
jgi:hypothetical protein